MLHDAIDVNGMQPTVWQAPLVWSCMKPVCPRRATIRRATKQMNRRNLGILLSQQAWLATWNSSHEETSYEGTWMTCIHRAIPVSHMSVQSSIWMHVQVTLNSGNSSCQQSFSKMKLVKTLLRNSMTSDRLSNTALLSTETSRAHEIDLECFVDEFHSRHDNRQIEEYCITVVCWTLLQPAVAI